MEKKEGQFIVFKLANEEFAVSIDEVLEITKLKDITRIPNSEYHITGVINLRGRIHLVINLVRKLGLVETDSNEDTRVIIVENNGGRVGIIVDSVVQVLMVEANNLKDIPESIDKNINSHYLNGVVIMDQRMIILLNLANILESDEKQIQLELN